MSAAVVHHGDAVAEPLGLVHVVRDEDDRRAAVAGKLDQLPGLAARDRIEPLGQLVEEDELRTVHERKGEEEPLALTARERSERLPKQRLETPGAASSRQSTASSASRANSRRASPTRSRSGSAEVWSCAPSSGRSRRALASRVEPEHLDASGVAMAQALEDLHRRRLSGAVAAGDAEDLARSRRENDTPRSTGSPS